MNKNDLTQGNIWKKMILFFLPLALGTIFQQLYNAVDGFIVSKYVGTTALAAVGGSASLISNALVNFFVAVTSGGSILIAQFFGASNHKALSKSVHTSLIFAAICGVIISIAGYIMTPTLLTWMKTPDDTMAESITYLHIIFLGVVFQVIYNMSAGILRAVGDSKSPFINLAISCGINIVADIVCVYTFKMGVAGAAYATIFSQGICCALTFGKLVKAKGESYAVKWDAFHLDAALLKRILRVGLPIGCQSLMYSVTNLVIQVGINSLGTVVVAAWALTSKLDGFFWGLMSAANATICNFVGQNYGKGDFDRIKKGIKVSFILFMGLSFAFCLVLLVTGKSIIPLFNDDPEVIDCAWLIVKFFAPIYWTWTVNEIFSGVLRGEGKTLISFFIIAFSICVFRFIWLFTAFKLYPTIICLSACYPLSWVIASVGMTIYYIIDSKKQTVVQ